MQKKVIIIGGGAAGFFCAANLRGESLSVLLLEKQKLVLQKVRVSGGGRCNVTHNCTEINVMTEAYPRGGKQLRQAFARFFTGDTIKWFESKGVKIKAEKDGRMFPVSDNSQDIIAVLKDEAERNHVRIWTESPVREVRCIPNGFQVITDKAELECDFLVLATGGFPKLEQYSWLSKLGLKIIDPVPSLFTFNVKDKDLHAIAGNSVSDVSVKINGTKLQSRGPILFTHWGFSGPAVLRLSALAARELASRSYEYSFAVNWLPAMKQDDLRILLNDHIKASADKIVHGNCPFGFSSSVWKFILQRAGIAETFRWRELGKKHMNSLVERLNNDQYKGEGKTTFKEEFVTCGGVDLDQVDFKTMQVKGIEGLFVCGELLDVDGITGGYNFQNAWTTAWIAAQAINAQAGA